MGGEAKATMQTYIGLNDIGSRPGVDSTNFYPEAVQGILLFIYARETLLHVDSREVREMVQCIGKNNSNTRDIDHLSRYNSITSDKNDV